MLKPLSVDVANEASAQSVLECDHERVQTGRACTKHATVVLVSYSASASYCAVEIANRFIVRRHVWSIETFAVRPPPFHWLLAKTLHLHVYANMRFGVYT